MEKISIVKRRIERGKGIVTAALIRAQQREEISKDKYISGKYSNIADCRNFDKFKSFHMELSPKQSETIDSKLELNNFIEGKCEGASVKIYKNKKNKVILHFILQPNKHIETLTSEEVCKMLKISRKTLYRKVHDNIIPGFKVGSQLRFLKEDVIMYVKGHQLYPQ